MNAGTKRFMFPEGLMTEDEWIRKYAESVEQYKLPWESLFDRRRFNRLEGDAQPQYEAMLKIRANRPRYRAWKAGSEMFVSISKAAFSRAKQVGIRVVGEANE